MDGCNGGMATGLCWSSGGVWLYRQLQVHVFELARVQWSVFAGQQNLVSHHWLSLWYSTILLSGIQKINIDENIVGQVCVDNVCAWCLYVCVCVCMVGVHIHVCACLCTYCYYTHIQSLTNTRTHTHTHTHLYQTFWLCMHTYTDAHNYCCAIWRATAWAPHVGQLGPQCLYHIQQFMAVSLQCHHSVADVNCSYLACGSNGMDLFCHSHLDWPSRTT